MNEDLDKLIKILDLKFSSLNEIPVERAPLTRAEWDQIRPILADATQRHRQGERG